MKSALLFHWGEIKKHISLGRVLSLIKNNSKARLQNSEAKTKNILQYIEKRHPYRATVRGFIINHVAELMLSVFGN